MANVKNNKNILVDYATTTNLTLIPMSNGQYRILFAGTLTIDGVAIGIGDITLFKDQTDLTQNLILQLIDIVDISGGNFNYYFEIPEIGQLAIPKDIVFVENGDTLAGSSYLLTIDTEFLTLGSSEITWLVFNSDDTGSTVFGVSPTTINALPRFNNTSANIIKDSAITVSDGGDFSDALIINNTNTIGADILNGLTTNVIINTVDAIADYVLKATSNSNATWQSIGTAPSTVNAIARWENTAGTVIKNSTVLLSDTGEITNATITASSNDVVAHSLRSATGIVTITGNPFVDSMLLASSATSAAWRGAWYFMISYSFRMTDLTISSTTYIVAGQIPFDLSMFQNNGYDQDFINDVSITGTLVDRSINCQIYDLVNATILGQGTLAGGPVRTINIQGFTLPTSDTLIQLLVKKSSAGGVDPILNGAVLNVANVDF